MEKHLVDAMTKRRKIWYRQYVLEWVDEMKCWRVFREENPCCTIAYVDDPNEAMERLWKEPDLYCESSDDFEVETCPHCEREVELRWNINEDGFSAWCPFCGERLMLCDACTHRHGDFHDDCSTTPNCRFERPKGWCRTDKEGETTDADNH